MNIFFFYLNQFVNHLPRARLFQLLTALPLIIVGSFLEVFSLALVVPFLTSISSEEIIISNSSLNSFISWLNISTNDEIIIILGILFVSAVILSGVTRLYIIWFSNLLSANIGHDMSIQAYENTLKKPFIEHKLSNSGDVIAAIITHIHITVLVINSLLTAASSFFTVLAVGIGLAIINPIETSIIAVTLFLSYLLITRIFNKRVEYYGNIIAENKNKKIKLIQESLGGIRDVLMNNRFKDYVESYNILDYQERNLLAKLTFLNRTPRVLVEIIFISILIIAGLIIAVVFQEKQLLIPTLGLFALASQKLLPNTQNIFNAWVTVRSSKVQIDETLKLLNQPAYSNFNALSSHQNLVFQDCIEFNCVSYQYPNNPHESLADINLKIYRGDKIGIIGTTGSGKSTFIDLLIALLEPSKGSIMIDGQILAGEISRQWQSLISHVPQEIFLFNKSLAENISLSKIYDYEKIRDAAEKSLITSLLEDCLGENVHKTLTERGSNLSGGQKQRIGIARAIYQNKPILILDEATSALDLYTEESILTALRESSVKLTIIMISHNLRTLEMCDKIIWLEDSKLVGYSDSKVILSKYKEKIAKFRSFNKTS
ncbi:possible multidrug efflux ABC transporter [Parasynechococcus marenigrum WH 8102]|uniref:Possible multidrug efflux ABC transporter n=1 Tax=Parasynechococcus marenigrum (strain WH8102) TaxID=84588 RepID=Q7U932_PARMW|nr:possible multidrug efflux ABC transporter [Parasynechococcus marenigrum WH 8102]